MAEAAHRGESIYGHTDSVFTAPDSNLGVPREPWILRVLSHAEVIVGVTLFGGIFVGVMYQVVGRYFPAVSWIGSGELALLSMVAMTFAMMGYLTGRNAHIVIELFDQLLRGRILFTVLRIVSALIVVVTSIALAYDATAKIEAEWTRVSAAMGIPMGILYIFALAGGISTAANSAWAIRHARQPERKLEMTED